jgi:chromosomal replication initiation ATPase DnaA
MYAASAQRTQAGIIRIQERRSAAERATIVQRMDSQASELQARIVAAQRMLDAIEAQRARAAEDICELRGSAEYRPTLRSIEAKAVKLFGYTRTELRSGRRSVPLVFARQFVMYWACRLTRLSLPQIGKLMGGRDHTTVLHGKNIYVEKRKAMNRKLRRAR